MDWQELTTVKKGNVGEELVNRYLIEHGFIPYSPAPVGAHPFDKLCASRDKKTIFVADSKAKPARTWYPDTGIDIRHYNDYMLIHDKYRLDIFLFFVDEDTGTIYGNFLRILDKPREILHKGKTLQYPMEYKGIRYFPLVAMETVGEIPNAELMLLRQFSTRKSCYSEQSHAF
jgi:hypothetical protein